MNLHDETDMSTNLAQSLLLVGDDTDEGWQVYVEALLWLELEHFGTNKAVIIFLN